MSSKLSGFVSSARDNIQSKKQVSGWVLPKQKSSVAPANVWSNADQDPVPPEKRTWTPLTFTLYWFSDLVTVSTWSQGSSIVAAGLSATDAILICFVAAICNAVPTVLNGAIGADLHVPFPIAARSAFGYWLSYFAVASPAILALFWFGVNTAGGGLAVTQMIKAIWPSYAHVPNHLPVSAGITTQAMISYLIYFIIQFPFLFIPMHKLRPMFMAKTILMPPVAIAMTVWIAHKAGNPDFFSAPAKVSGSVRAWLWLSSLTSVTGGFSTLAVNIPDFSRFSNKPGSQFWQLPVIPIFKVAIGTCGVVSAAASAKVYGGKPLWNPLLIIDHWQTTPSGRAAAFFAAFCWCLAQICLNVSANSLSFANDLTSMFPKWINIRRASVICTLVGSWILCPWLILQSGATFLNFMSAYAIFMAPLAGLLLCDYWIIKKRRYDVPALYDPEGIYGKCNWRSLVILVLVIVPLTPGLAQKVTPAKVHIPTGLKNLFAINWLYGFFLSMILYLVLNLVFPQRETLIPKVVHGTPVFVEDVDEESGSDVNSTKERVIVSTDKI